MGWVTAAVLSFSLLFGGGGEFKPKVIEKAMQSVVSITDLEQGGVCSAVSVAPGYYLSAAHCSVLDEMVTSESTTIPVEIIALDGPHDLMLLKADFVVRSVKMYRDGLKVGEPAFSLGYGFGNPQMVGFHYLSAIYSGFLLGEPYSEDMYVFWDSFVNGMSGGPIFNTKGELVSVVQAGRLSSIPAHDVGVAVHTNVVREFLATHLPSERP